MNHSSIVGVTKGLLSVTILLLGLCSSISAWGQGTFGVSYAQIDDSDIGVGALVSSVGYRYELSDSFALVPEIRGGIGIKDDSYAGINVKLKGLAAAALRTELKFSDHVYNFGAISYGRYRFKVSVPGTGSDTGASNDVGYGGGLGFSFSGSPDSVRLEIGYEDIDSVGIFSAGLRYRF